VISIIIPTLNEAGELPATLRRAQEVLEVREIIVVDAGSSDGTDELATQVGCRLLRARPSRGGQMRAGAAAAKSEIVLLLHADTWLPPDAGQAVVACLNNPRIVGGGFWKVFRERNLLLRGSRFRCAIRFYLGGRFMGDQGIFARRQVLEAAGGVPDIPLMEEFELCRRLRRFGKLALANATVQTSARRFARLGVPRTYARMWWVTLRYYLGAKPEELSRIYHKDWP